jgi:hypothetical protein
MSSEVFKNKYGYSPCLVVDGADLIAKKDPPLFTNLINHTKYLANSQTLQIILVSSEAIDIMMIDATSSNQE